MDTKEELYLEYARCINMCKGTDVKSWECVRYARKMDADIEYRWHPRFESDSKCYKFAIFILEGKPVFLNDKVYAKDTGTEYVIKYPDGFNWQNMTTWTPSRRNHTFMLNGVELSCPVSKSPTAYHLISIRSSGFVEYFGFESVGDADLVALELIKILRTAFEERSKS